MTHLTLPGSDLQVMLRAAIGISAASHCFAAPRPCPSWVLVHRLLLGMSPKSWFQNEGSQNEGYRGTPQTDV